MILPLGIPRGNISMVQDGGAGDALFKELLAVLPKAILRNRKGNMVHRAMGSSKLTLEEGLGIDRGNARDGLGGAGEPKEGETLASANVEEEMLAAVGELDGLDEGQAEQPRVEVDSAGHVGGDQG